MRSLARALHRLHRFVGSALCLLLAMWFASGAVMTFARYPSYAARERLRDSEPLSAIHATLPERLSSFVHAGGLASGARVRLAQLEGEPTWLWTALDGTRVAERAQPPFALSWLTPERVVSELSRLRHVPAKIEETLDTWDQWTVATFFRGFLPMSRVSLEDGLGTEVYVSLRTGEIVQESTRRERLLAWLGPIPHWIYPAALRAQGTVWRTTVLTLAGFGLVLAVSGLVVGGRVARARVRRGLGPVRDFALRWHQRLGLFFGVLVCTWLASGALSLSPFGLNKGPYPEHQDLMRLHGPHAFANVAPIGAALEQCRRELVPHELELASIAGRLVVVCSDASANTRVVDLSDPLLRALRELDRATVRAALAQLSPDEYGTIGTQARADAYYYPTHANPLLPLPVTTFDDRGGVRFYFDPRKAELVAKHDAATRRDRFLYNGLHSFDWPLLYAYRTAWRSVVLIAMGLGFTLSVLGLVMFVRRGLRRRGRRRTQRRTRQGVPESELGLASEQRTRLTRE